MLTNLRETVSCYFSRNKNQTCALSTKNFLIESVSDDNDVIKGAVVLGWGRQISENSEEPSSLLTEQQTEN